MMRRALGWVAGVGLLFAIFMVLPIPISPNYDFSVLYYSLVSLKQGIPLYAYAQQVEFLHQITPANFEFHPFPYPPWLAVLAYPLVWLPPVTAAKLWAACNLGMVVGAAWLLSDGWPLRNRLAGAVASALFLPSIGLAMVGQYSGLPLLGAALMVQGTRKARPLLTIGGMLLALMKPHFGGLALLALAFGWGGIQPNLRKRTLGGFALFMVAVALLSFLVDPRWLFTYPQSLISYSELEGVAMCAKCASLVAVVLRHGGLLQSLFPVGITAFAVILGGTYLLRKKWLGQFTVALPALFLLGTLLLPYIQLYDYALLLPAILLLAGKDARWLAISPLSWLAISAGLLRELTLPLLALFLLIVLFLKTDPDGTIDQTATPV